MILQVAPVQPAAAPGKIKKQQRRKTWVAMVDTVCSSFPK
jgi:hypothetical protein